MTETSETGLLIIDFEATCDDRGALPAADMEIIEIGAVLLDARRQVVGQFQRFVKPVKNPVLTNFCTKLTGIHQRDVETARTFPEAAHGLEAWLRLTTPIAPAAWASWGAYDRKQLRRDCERHQVAHPLDVPHCNVKKAFEHIHGGRGWSLQDALGHRGMRFEGSLHRGLDDALNIARILQKDSRVFEALGA